MNYLLLLLFIFFYTSINSQLLDEKLNKELISYYEEYLITNPQPSNIIEISDTLRILWDNVNMLNYHSYCYCNCIEVIIKNNKVFLEGKRIKLSRLQEKMFSYYNNYERKQYLPEREVLKDTLFGFFVRSKGIFDIISFNANPSVYSEVIKISKNIFNAERNYWATILYEKEYEKLDENTRNYFDKLFPYKIRFERYRPDNLYLPPPPIPQYELKAFPLPCQDSLTGVDL